MSKSNRIKQNKMKNTGNKSGVFVIINRYVIRQSLTNGAKIVLAYLMSLALNNQKNGKASIAYVDAASLSKDLNMPIRTVYNYLSILVTWSHIKARKFGRRSFYEVLNLNKISKDNGTEPVSMVTSTILSDDSINAGEKITQGLIALKGLKTDSHAFDFDSASQIAEEINVSRSTAYRYLDMLKESNRITSVNSKYHLRSMDGYSLKKAEEAEIKYREMIAFKDSLISSEPTRVDRKAMEVIDKIFNKI